MNETATSSNQLNLSTNSSQDENSQYTSIEEGFSLISSCLISLYFLIWC